jgi:hypothetical protein
MKYDTMIIINIIFSSILAMLLLIFTIRKIFFKNNLLDFIKYSEGSKDEQHFVFQNNEKGRIEESHTYRSKCKSQDYSKNYLFNYFFIY